MVDLYVDLINKGLYTIDEVPDMWRADVEKALAEQGKK